MGTASSLSVHGSSLLLDPTKPLNNNKSTSTVVLCRTGFSYSSGFLHLSAIFMPDLRWCISSSWQEVCKTSLALLGHGEYCYSAKPSSGTAVFCPCSICQLSMLKIIVHLTLSTGEGGYFCHWAGHGNASSPSLAGCFSLHPFSTLIYLAPKSDSRVSVKGTDWKIVRRLGGGQGRSWTACSWEADFFRKLG